LQIKYEVSGKVHSVYRRSHGPDGDFHKASGDRQGNPGGASAWEKEGAKFNAFELMSGCWRSKQSSGGAPNAIATDFQIFATEAAYFDRSSHPGWAFCNYDDCSDKGGNEVGFPRDCGPAAPGIRNQWHQFVSLPPATSRMQPLACNLLERLLQPLASTIRAGSAAPFAASFSPPHAAAPRRSMTRQPDASAAARAARADPRSASSVQTEGGAQNGQKDVAFYVNTVRAALGRLSALGVFLLSKVIECILYGALVSARRALNSRKRRFPARSVRRLDAARDRARRPDGRWLGLCPPPPSRSGPPGPVLFQIYFGSSS
jgi:hypothetical protein